MNKVLPYTAEILSEHGIRNDTLVQFKNCRVLRDNTLKIEDFWVKSGKIINPEPIFFDQKRSPDLQVDCKNLVLAPGLIDIQINGAFGVDFSTAESVTPKNISRVRKGLLSYGITSFCPTIVSSQPLLYQQVLPKLQRCEGCKEGAGILGVHLEGPFISSEKRGAHHLENLVDHFDIHSSLTSVYGSLDNCSILTLAPELPNAIPVIEKVVQKGVAVSLGHSTASIAEGEAALKAGACSLTHLFNAMLPFHHRDPGLVGLLASGLVGPARPLYYGVISDGIHTHDAALRIAHKTHPEGLVLVSDAISALGLGDGAHLLGDVTIETTGHRAVLAGTDTLSGSVSSLDHCVRHLVRAARCSIVEALTCATGHPAAVVGVGRCKGSLGFHTDADFVLLDDDLYVQATFIGGQLVWSRK